MKEKIFVRNKGKNVELLCNINPAILPSILNHIQTNNQLTWDKAHMCPRKDTENIMDGSCDQQGKWEQNSHFYL